MSVIVTLSITGDPEAFERTLSDNSDTVTGIMEIAKSHGLIAHRWYAGEGEFMAIDEWPGRDSFDRFFEAAQSDIGPLMEQAGVTSPPVVKSWTKLDAPDEYGWGA